MTTTQIRNHWADLYHALYADHEEWYALGWTDEIRAGDRWFYTDSAYSFSARHDEWGLSQEKLFNKCYKNSTKPVGWTGIVFRSTVNLDGLDAPAKKIRMLKPNPFHSEPCPLP